MSYAIARPIGDRMTTAEWVDLFKYSRLRQYFIDMARALSRDPYLREDLYQEAWMAVGESPADKREDYYQQQGLRAMDRYRKRIYPSRPRRIEYNERRRIKKVVKKYFLRRGKK